MTASDWRYASATVTGSSHERLGTECQDASSCLVETSSDGEKFLLAAVADGAGSSSRGGVGSEIACATVIACIREALRDAGSLRDIDIEDAVGWIRCVQAAISTAASAEELPVREFACTLLLAVVGEHEALFGQIGDGVTVVLGDEGDDSYSYVFWPMRGEYANTTYFVTGEDATDRMSFDRLNRRVDELAMMTDGIESLVLHYQERRVHEPLLRRLFPAVRSADADRRDSLSAALAQWLRSPAVCARSDDDKTLILATRCSPSALSDLARSGDGDSDT